MPDCLPPEMLRRDFPHVPVQFLSSGEPTVPNAKILSLEKMAEAAKYDLLIISDSDVRVDSNYVRDVVAPFADAAVGAVTCLYRGVAAQGGVWSRIEAAAMSVEMSAGVLVADMLEGMKFALGPTMAIRRSCLNEIGGFLPMGDYCADDFLLGNWVAERGHTGGLVASCDRSRGVACGLLALHAAPGAVDEKHTFLAAQGPPGHGAYLQRSLWTADGGGSLRPSTAIIGLCWRALRFCGVLARECCWPLAVSHFVVREKSAAASVFLYPVRDLLGILFWAASYCSRNVLWRNEIYRLETGGRMRRIHR